MQTEVFTHLSLFKIHKYVSGAKSVCDFMKKPRPCYFFAAMLEGSAVFETALGEKIPIEAGDLIFIPKGSKYRSFWNEKQENVHISLHFDFEPFFGFKEAESLMIQKISKSESDDLAKRLMLAWEDSDRGDLRALSLFYDFLRLFLPILKRAPHPANDRRLTPAIDHIRTHLSEDTPASELAALCSMSEPNLYLLFKKQLGESPVEYKNRLRIERAQQLLLSYPDMPIEQIADTAGYESAAYFRRRFKEATGESPRDYRRRGLEKGHI